MKIFVGYDTREDIAYQVCKHSIESLCPTAEVIPLKQNELRNDKLYWRGEDKLASTEFTFTRFLIPHLMNYNGWALFIDSDIVFTENVKNLFDITDRSYVLGEHSVIAEGTSRELLKSTKAIKHYFGSQFS